MKILFLNHLPLVGSGSGVYTTNLAKSLILLGHEVCSIMPENETKNVYDETFKGIKMHPVYFKNEEEIKEFKTDIIHSGHIWIISKIACKYDIPVVVTSHGTDVIGLQKGDRFKEDAEFVIKHAKKIIAVSNDNSRLIKELFPESNPIVVNAGFDPRIFNVQEYDTKEILEKYKIEYTNQKIVLYAGRLSHLKGLDVLLKAAKIYEKKQDIITLLVGNGALRKELKNLAKELELRNVYFLGHKRQRTLKKLYNIADVFSISSRQEAFGLVGVEALACGLPVVSTKVGGMKDYVNNKVGKLVNVEDEEELAKALLYIINHKEKYDKDNLANYAKENFAQEKTVNKLLSIYKEAIEK